MLAAYLLAGRTRSCGCLRAERARASIAVARADNAAGYAGAVYILR